MKLFQEELIKDDFSAVIRDEKKAGSIFALKQEGDIYSQKAEQYEELCRNIKAEWQKRFLSTAKVPSQSTQCGYLMALRYNLLPDESSITRTRNYLHRAIANNTYKLNTGFLGTAILNQTDCKVLSNSETVPSSLVTLMMSGRTL